MSTRQNMKFFLLIVSILLLVSLIPLHAEEIGKGVKITFLGHSGFKIVSPKGVVIYIDPFLSKNPKIPQEMKTAEKADLILVTHGHWDHIGDTLTIAEKTNAEIIVIYELGKYLSNKGAENVVGMNKGGTYTSHGIAITMVHANHSSSIFEGDQIIYL